MAVSTRMLSNALNDHVKSRLQYVAEQLVNIESREARVDKYTDLLEDIDVTSLHFLTLLKDRELDHFVFMNHIFAKFPL